LIAGDTALSKLEVLSQLEKAIGSVSDGINQIIFVTRGRLTAEEVNVFDIVQNTLFDGLAMYLCLRELSEIYRNIHQNC
jgi:DNA-binding protein